MNRRRMASKVRVTGKKTVQDFLNNKGIVNGSQALEALRGKTVTIIYASSYGKNGDKIKVDSSWLAAPNCGPALNGYIYQQTNGNALYFKHLIMAAQTVGELTSEIAENEKMMKELEADNNLIRSRIEFMEANSLEEYDEDVFKTYEVLKQLNKKTTDIEKAKIIAKIIKGS